MLFDTLGKGTGAVKIKGGMALGKIIALLKTYGIPVMGHVGLTPRSVHTLGGYKVQGRTNENFSQILKDAQALDRAGACAIVVEADVEALGRSITETLVCPTIGTGASPACDGQVLVVDDLLGMTKTVRQGYELFDAIADCPTGNARSFFTKQFQARPITLCAWVT